MSESQDNVAERQDTWGAADHVDLVLAQWAAVRPDLDTSPVAVVARIGRVTAYLDAAINARLAEFGLARSSWDVLASLRRAGPPYRLSPTDLYLSLMRTSGAMTHRLAGLERSGLVRRRPDPDDGRSLLVELTRKGLALVDRAAEAHLDNERALLAALTPGEQETLADLLRTLLRAFEQREPGPPPARRRRMRSV
jgi:DNA-binding MarR family transcriptional regulator